MELKVEVEKVDDVRRRLAVEVPADTVVVELERGYADLARSVTLPGFRRGRVPRPVLERMFGERVRAQVFERLIHDSFVEAVGKSELPIVGQPEFETEAARPGEALRYRALIEVRPEVTARDYVGIEVERPQINVDEPQVNAILERLRESHARLHPISDRDDVQLGDVVTLDYKANLDGRSVGSGERREIEVGRNGFPPEFDSNLLGARVPGELRFSAAYPRENHVSDVAGKTVDFELRVRAISRKELPSLDDDFAKTHGDSATVQELHERVRQDLEREAARQADESVRHQLLGKLVETNDIGVPKAMIARRLDALVEDAWDDWRRQGIRPRGEQAAKEQLRNELEERARNQVKLSLLLEAIARQEGLQVSDQEVEERLEQITTQAGAAAERVRALYSEPSAREQLRANLLHSRAVDVIARAARVRPAASESKIADAGENG